LAFGLGWILDDVTVIFKMSTAGFVLSCLIVLPDWPCFNRHPLKWQEPRAEEEETVPEAQPTRKSSGSSKPSKSKRK
jgi:signal peptidase complex subunit 1